MAERVPTDDEWTWTYNRVTGARAWPASYALLHLVWEAVHLDGWSVPKVTEWEIVLERRHDLGSERVEVWRDRLGRFRTATRSVAVQTDHVRSLAAMGNLLILPGHCHG